MNDRLKALQLFVRVAHAESFSAAGRELGLSQPSVSRIIAELEEEVGAALFIRTTRAVKLTDAGIQYLSRIEAIHSALDEADHEARGTGELRGTLRVGLSSTLANREIIPRLPAFTKRNPELRLELYMADRRQDLIEEGIDVALRFGTLTDSVATARKLASWPRILVAAPDYVAQRGDPASPKDLANHQLIAGPTARANVWEFRRGDEAISIHPDRHMIVTSNDSAIAASIAGLGIISTIADGCKNEIASGSLMRVLSDWDMGMVDLHALFPGGRVAKPAARAFASYLSDAFREQMG
ncbi:LysR family transcriptional regulator [Mesorhizobium sp.]|uniref:LysR family transcriptional regulator n=1 Tax=Mesorhizobium sp. TaxID=1871066 RepID=UPI000FE85E7B|nr:LysR family transcriptional regulator [Mesorhizobium sp.]RWE79567.1 MAG: LysR family transcriptional regulator [Mesorhizobium sp.]